MSTEPRKGPDLPALIACARRLATGAGMAPPPDDATLNRLDEILFRRGQWEAHWMGLTTRNEIVMLVLQHLLTLATDDSLDPDEDAAALVEDIRADVDRALFDAGGREAP